MQARFDAMADEMRLVYPATNPSGVACKGKSMSQNKWRDQLDLIDRAHDYADASRDLAAPRSGEVWGFCFQMGDRMVFWTLAQQMVGRRSGERGRKRDLLGSCTCQGTSTIFCEHPDCRIPYVRAGRYTTCAYRD